MKRLIAPLIIGILFGLLIVAMIANVSNARPEMQPPTLPNPALGTAVIITPRYDKVFLPLVVLGEG
ncbi:MAG: hypothetical protein GY943_00940 [Chloroflexi bacterium]|nr:hypothetical protein [Chloroflexota bacterium]